MVSKAKTALLSSRKTSDSFLKLETDFLPLPPYNSQCITFLCHVITRFPLKNNFYAGHFSFDTVGNVNN